MKVLSKVKKYLICISCIALSHFLKRDKNYLAFGSWGGDLYIDNTKYIFEQALLDYPDRYFIWIGNENVSNEIYSKFPNRKNITVVKKDSLKSIYLLLKSKYMFCSQVHDMDLCTYNVFAGAIIIYLHHGFPIKKWGADGADGHKIYDFGRLEKLKRHILGLDIKYDYFPVSSEFHNNTNLSSLSFKGYKEENSIKSGTPRNDFLINQSKNDRSKLKNYYAKTIGFDPDKKVILYMPTFRRSGTISKSFVFGINSDEKQGLVDTLNRENAVIIEKSHSVESLNHAERNASINDNCIYHIDRGYNPQELLSIADVFISDYSSAIMDFILLDRPIIYFVYDYEFYKNEDSGLYYDIEEYSAGEIVTDEHLISDAIVQCIEHPSHYSSRRHYIREKYMRYECGAASKAILEAVIEV